MNGASVDILMKIMSGIIHFNIYLHNFIDFFIFLVDSDTCFPWYNEKLWANGGVSPQF